MSKKQQSLATAPQQTSILRELHGFWPQIMRMAWVDIQKEYSLTLRKAQLLARDQVSSLNAQISKMQQQDAGCTKYRWSTSKDSRVRDCHRALEGKIFNWDDPPEMWYETKSRGRVSTGRRCNPGEDYCCRCVAIPVFDFNTVDVPIRTNEKD